MDYTNKTVLITGASPDFGQTLAIQFAKSNANLILTARTLEKAQQTAEVVKQVSRDIKIQCFQLDLSEPADISNLAKQLEQNQQTIELLIHNASYWPYQAFFDSSDEEIIQAVDSTATGSMLVTKHLLPFLLGAVNADVVFINSTAGLPNDGHPTSNDAFSAAKAAQSTFADRLRVRLAPQDIRVIAIYPNNFDNPSPLIEADWNEQRNAADSRAMTARNVFNAIQFALEQDRKCSIDKIVLNSKHIG